MFYEILEKVKSQKPLIHHITNWVTIYDCANITRAFGALPVMAHSIEEAAEMTGISSALVLNIGTLTPELIESMLNSGKKANEKGIPIVLDAVGAGATTLRNEKSFQLLDEIHIDIIKGNASEIALLAGENVQTRGVETTEIEADLIKVAKKLATERKSVAVITGKEDIVTDGSEGYIIKNGHPYMGSIVGTGCMAASVIGAFAAVERNYPLAAAAALSCYGIAGELAALKCYGPGSFKVLFYDEVYNLNHENIERMKNVERF